jgi:hypothetical protein
VRGHGCQLTVVGGVRGSGRAAILICCDNDSEDGFANLVSVQCNNSLEDWKRI